MTKTRVSVEKWKTLAKDGEDATRDLAVVVASASELKLLDEGARVITCKASSATPDRDGDTISPTGWKLDGFAKNGPILWAHNPYEPPVARARKTWFDASALYAEMEFAGAEVYAFAETVYQLIKGGFLNAVSVGFRPLKWTRNEGRGPFAIDFVEQELLEISIVPIPSNPDALIQARSAGGIDCAPVIEWAEKFLDGAKGPGLWVPVPRERVERAREVLLGDPVQAQVPASKGTAATVVDKRGRVLSAANESTLRAAADAVDKAADNIRAVLAQVEQAEESDDAGKAAPQSQVEELITSKDVAGIFAELPSMVVEAVKSTKQKIGA
jgi:HK97 family phage prohead protease